MQNLLINIKKKKDYPKSARRMSYHSQDLADNIQQDYARTPQIHIPERPILLRQDTPLLSSSRRESSQGNLQGSARGMSQHSEDDNQSLGRLSFADSQGSIVRGSSPSNSRVQYESESLDQQLEEESKQKRNHIELQSEQRVQISEDDGSENESIRDNLDNDHEDQLVKSPIHQPQAYQQDELRENGSHENTQNQSADTFGVNYGASSLNEEVCRGSNPSLSLAVNRDSGDISNHNIQKAAIKKNQNQQHSDSPAMGAQNSSQLLHQAAQSFGVAESQNQPQQDAVQMHPNNQQQRHRSSPPKRKAHQRSPINQRVNASNQGQAPQLTKQRKNQKEEDHAIRLQKKSVKEEERKDSSGGSISDPNSSHDQVNMQNKNGQNAVPEQQPNQNQQPRPQGFIDPQVFAQQYERMLYLQNQMRGQQIGQVGHLAELQQQQQNHPFREQNMQRQQHAQPAQEEQKFIQAPNVRARAPAHNPAESASESYRESTCIPGSDPLDINQGQSFVFLKEDATTRMRQGKRRVRYIFQGEADSDRANQNSSVEIQSEKNQVQKKSNRSQVEQRRDLNKDGQQVFKSIDMASGGESGQTPENFADKESNKSHRSRRSKQSSKRSRQSKKSRQSRQSRQSLGAQRPRSQQDLQPKMQNLQAEEAKVVYSCRQNQFQQDGDISDDSSVAGDASPYKIRSQNSIKLKRMNMSMSENNHSNKAFSLQDDFKKKSFDTEKPHSNSPMCRSNNDLNLSMQNNLQQVSHNSSFSSGSAFGNYSFHQASKAAYQADMEQKKAAAAMQRRRSRAQHPANLNGDLLPQQIHGLSVRNDQKVAYPADQSLGGPAAGQGNNPQVNHFADQVRKEGQKYNNDNSRPPMLKLPKVNGPLQGPQSMVMGQSQAINSQNSAYQSGLDRMQERERALLQKKKEQQKLHEQSSHGSAAQRDSQSAGKSQYLQVPHLDMKFDASKQLPDYVERRRGSVVESRTDANKELMLCNQKQVKVRTPRRGRSKSIVVPGTDTVPRSFPIGRLNNYNKTMKKHKGPLSMMSELESIDEVELSEKFDSSRNNREGRGQQAMDPRNFYFDADQQKDDLDQNSAKQAEGASSKSFSNSKNSQSGYVECQNNPQITNQNQDLLLNYNAVESESQQVAQELKKILQHQNLRNRSHSVIQRSSHAPVLQPIKNFGHGRRSNLVQKVQQLQRRAQRCKSIAMGELNTDQILLRAQLLMNSQQEGRQKIGNNNPAHHQAQALRRFQLEQQKEQVMKMTQNQLAQMQMQQESAGDQNQFSDYLMQFKNRFNQQSEPNMQPSPFIREHGASVKPLGLNKNKARAALNNLKNGSLTPKGAESSDRRSSVSGKSSDMDGGQQLNRSGGEQKFRNYTFSEAQNQLQHANQQHAIEKARALSYQSQQMEMLHHNLNKMNGAGLLNNPQAMGQGAVDSMHVPIGQQPFLGHHQIAANPPLSLQMQMQMMSQYANHNFDPNAQGHNLSALQVGIPAQNSSIDQSQSLNLSSSSGSRRGNEQVSAFGQYKFGQSKSSHQNQMGLNSNSSGNGAQEESKQSLRGSARSSANSEANNFRYEKSPPSQSKSNRSHNSRSKGKDRQPASDGPAQQVTPQQIMLEAQMQQNLQGLDLVKMMEQLTKNGSQDDIIQVMNVLSKLQNQFNNKKT